MALPADFADRVLAVLRSTRPGEVVTYGGLAADAGFPRQARAVGRVLALAGDEGTGGAALPWWRVVRSDGSLSEADPDEQAARLRAEGVSVQRGRVPRGVLRPRSGRRPPQPSPGRR